MEASGKPDLNRPRHIAFRIARMRSKERRNKALDNVPEEWRALVKTHVENIYARRN